MSTLNKHIMFQTINLIVVKLEEDRLGLQSSLPCEEVPQLQA